MKILAIFLAVIGLFNMSLLKFISPDSIDIELPFEKETTVNLVKGIIIFEGLVEMICAVYILFL